jgi:hypothetical protein
MEFDPWRVYSKEKEISRFHPCFSEKKVLFMQIYQTKLFPLDKMRAIVSTEPVETLVVVQVATPDEHVLREKKGEENATESASASPPGRRQFVLPPWPTSQPGPEVTAPSPGQRLVPTRTDQVTYDFYDQERGRPGLPPARTVQARESPRASVGYCQLNAMLGLFSLESGEEEVFLESFFAKKHQKTTKKSSQWGKLIKEKL